MSPTRTFCSRSFRHIRLGTCIGRVVARSRATIVKDAVSNNDGGVAAVDVVAKSIETVTLDEPTCVTAAIS